MCELFENNVSQIKGYCKKNALDFERLKNLSECWGNDFVAFQYYDKSLKADFFDDTPLPLVLIIKKAENGLEFEQTEYTQKYLGVDSED